jgi:outer membrane receptor for ferrienterochelin and colicins
VATPFENQTVRLTYNRAYSAPTTNELFLDIVGNESLLFDVRGSGVPQSGYTFDYTGGRHSMYVTSFAAGGQRTGQQLPLGPDPALWEVVKAVVKANPATDEFTQLLKQYADMVPAPPAQAVGIELRMLNATSGAFEAYAPEGGRVPDRPAIRPTINQTIELGYKGVIAERIVLGIDLYRSHYTDFVGPLEVITPSVFYNREQLAGYLTQVFIQGGLSADSAQLFGAIAADLVAGRAGDKTATGIPLATVTPTQASDPRAVMLTYRNYGDITLYGYDIGLQLGITEGLAINGSLSYVDKNFFENLDGVADLSLNAPKFKFSVGAEYDNPSIGFNADVRMRHVDGYPVRSGVYIGSVPGYSVVDMTLGYRLPWVEGMSLAVSAQNLLTFVEEGEGSAFEQRHVEFVGVPALGRLVLARLTYSFK